MERLQLQRSTDLALTLQLLMKQAVKVHNVQLARVGHCGSPCSQALANIASAADGLHPVADAAVARGYRSNPIPPAQSDSAPQQWRGLYWAAATAELAMVAKVVVLGPAWLRAMSADFPDPLLLLPLPLLLLLVLQPLHHRCQSLEIGNAADHGHLQRILDRRKQCVVGNIRGLPN